MGRVPNPIGVRRESVSSLVKGFTLLAKNKKLHLHSRKLNRRLTRILIFYLRVALLLRVQSTVSQTEGCTDLNNELRRLG
jgi:hypothetical protein